MSDRHGPDRAERVARVIGGVLRQAVCDAGARGITLLDAQSPEGCLARGWAEAALGGERVHVVHADELDVVATAVRQAHPGILRAELERAVARTAAARAGTLLAHPVNKTVMLMGRVVPPEPLLPLGDLYASQVEQLAGAWSGPDDVRELAVQAGGVAALDAVLEQMLEGRRAPAAAVAQLEREAGERLIRALEAGRFWRRRVGLIPKLGSRTPGIDLLG